tara:strand:+ start:108 stop:254 length:147 start_codon:yes stop_codon:yes gene_type:complete
MSKITKLSTFSIPTIIGIGFAFVAFQIMKSEKQLIDRELELNIQFDKL